MDKHQVKAARKSLGLNQRDFASTLGVAASLVGAWESGAKRVADRRAEQINQMMGCRLIGWGWR